MVERHVRYWNEGRYDDWLALWPEDIVNEDPRGTTVGKHQCAVESWTRAQAQVRLAIKQLAVLGDDVAAVITNRVTDEGQPFAFDSIEIWTFLPDGGLRVRVYYDLAGADTHE